MRSTRDEAERERFVRDVEALVIGAVASLIGLIAGLGLAQIDALAIDAARAFAVFAHQSHGPVLR